ncbi:uncharacterized protein VICG_00577 [Vittaforma corneae ATCC 50505]|uniref:HECT-type E3 ubiquitin transferase n=1 Tax=Vittaforma corneae (strain ATCC 50505) TaxID=993615 RepID=L2GNK6_VITCO|nr:uncharacterized protein VICG_00577 [Vittaforma corneae ATCC 50505]ELA42478.1 hypothetical protein VICG_00577 [Vittaforma corneae ATCC 50505]
MSKYIKQLTQKCNASNCIKAFCRTVPDSATVQKISKILSKYGDTLTCRKIQKLNSNDKKLDKNLIIDSLFYINGLFYSKEKAMKSPSTFNLDDTLFKQITPNENVKHKEGACENESIASTKRETKEESNMIRPCKDLNHRFCSIISQSPNFVDSYLLTGVLHVFLNKFKTHPDFNLSLIIIRLFNIISKDGDIDVSFYRILANVFLTIKEKTLTSLITPFLKEHERCDSGKCLFCFDLSKNDLVECIQSIHSLIDYTFPVDFRENNRITCLFEIFECLFLINEKFLIVEESNFVVKKFFSTINLKNELKFCKLKLKSPLDHTFAIPIDIKAEILKTQNGEYMKASLQDAFFKALFQGITQPYLFINIRRDRLYIDTLKIILEVDGIDIKKQLKVKFLGEEGVDSGGIKKEYFLLLGHEIENDTSLFTQTNNRIWFRKGVDLQLLNTIGKIVGIALYNDVVLNVPFPSLLFKKLLHIPLDFDDLEEIEPEIYNSLKNLQRCSPEDFQFLDQNFTADFEVLGRRINYELIEDGSGIKVNKKNLEEFTQLYWSFLMEGIIEDEFKAFSDGFYSIINFENVKKFQPHELEKILMGVDDLDFELIKKTTTYNGYEPKDEIIEHFWEFFYEMCSRKKKRLIQFITGNDRLPVGGSTALNLIIMKNGCDTDRLPSSQTCFNTLLLPEYSSREKLRDKLGKAIGLTAGFFLM